MDDRFAVTKTSGVKVESSELRQAAYRFFEVLAHVGKAKATGIVCAFCSKQYPTVLLPKEGKLSAGMTWDVNRPNAPRNREHVPTLDLVFHRCWFNPCFMSEANTEDRKEDRCALSTLCWAACHTF